MAMPYALVLALLAHLLAVHTRLASAKPPPHWRHTTSPHPTQTGFKYDATPVKRVPYAPRCSVLKKLASNATERAKGVQTGLLAFSPENRNVPRDRCIVCVEAHRIDILPPPSDAPKTTEDGDVKLDAKKSNEGPREDELPTRIVAVPNRNVKIWVNCHHDVTKDVKFGLLNNFYQLVHSGRWTPKDVCVHVATSPYGEVEGGNRALELEWDADHPWGVPLLAPWLSHANNPPMHFLWPNWDYYGAPCGDTADADKPLAKYQTELWGAPGGAAATDFQNPKRKIPPWDRRRVKTTVRLDMSQRDGRRHRLFVCADGDPYFQKHFDIADTSGQMGGGGGHAGSNIEPFNVVERYQLHLEDNFNRPVAQPRGGFRDVLGRLMSVGGTVLAPESADRMTLSERVLEHCPAVAGLDFGTSGPSEEVMPCSRRFHWDGGICSEVANFIPGDATDAHRMAVALQAHVATQYDESCVLDYMATTLNSIQYKPSPGSHSRDNAVIVYDTQVLHRARELQASRGDGNAVLNEVWVRHGFEEVGCHTLSAMLRYTTASLKDTSTYRHRRCVDRYYQWFDPETCLPRWERAKDV